MNKGPGAPLLAAKFTMHNIFIFDRNFKLSQLVESIQISARP